jgi:hypothetical protein
VEINIVTIARMVGRWEIAVAIGTEIAGIVE